MCLDEGNFERTCNPTKLPLLDYLSCFSLNPEESRGGRSTRVVGRINTLISTTTVQRCGRQPKIEESFSCCCCRLPPVFLYKSGREGQNPQSSFWTLPPHHSLVRQPLDRSLDVHHTCTLLKPPSFYIYIYILHKHTTSYLSLNRFS